MQIFRKHTGNRHDDLCREQDKAGIELATKAFQPQVRELLIRLLLSHEDEARG